MAAARVSLGQGMVVGVLVAAVVWQAWRMSRLEERLATMTAPAPSAVAATPQAPTMAPRSALAPTTAATGSAITPAAHAVPAAPPQAVLAGLAPAQLQALRSLDEQWATALQAASTGGAHADWGAVAAAAAAREAKLRELLPDAPDPVERAGQIAAAQAATSISVAAPDGKVYRAALLPARSAR